MELDKCINERRSIRKYLDKPIEKEKIIELIEAAQKAPSWKNSQVSRFYVVDTKKTDFESCLAEFNKVNVKNAPIIIVSTVKKNRSGFERDGSYSTHLKEGFQYFDNGLQVQNLCLKAYDLGLGTLIMGLYEEKKIRETLNIPEEQEIVTVIAVGYPDENPEMPKRKNIKDIVKFINV